MLALGGGAILDADTRALLAGLPVVFLAMDVAEAVKRVGLDAARPLLAVNPRRQWRELMEARRPLYTEVARAVVATDDRTPEEVAEAVLDALELKERMTDRDQQCTAHPGRRQRGHRAVRGAGRPAAARRAARR